MRITSIEMAGQIDKTTKLPHAIARITRKIDAPHGRCLDVEILRPATEKTYRWAADPEADLWTLAAALQHQLDGHRGTNSMIQEYHRVLQYLAD